MQDEPVLGARRGLRRGLAVALFGGLSFLLWRGEVEYLKGWHGLQWLEGYPWASLPICVLVALSALSSVPDARQLPLARRALFVCLVAMSAWACFEMSRRWFHRDVRWLAFAPQAGEPRVPIDYWLTSPAASIVLMAFALQQSVRRLLVPIGLKSLAFFVPCLVLVWPLGAATVSVLAPHGHTDLVHAVKAGYPAFWINILVATATALAVRFGQTRGEATVTR